MDESPNEAYCVWQFWNARGNVAYEWRTGCGRELDLPIGAQPGKHLGWNYCMFCGREISDATVDC